jgi:N-acetylglucosaminyldiphosphoundecaprenol N-acetyl-beta-D-mannosaminyltransferase
MAERVAISGVRFDLVRQEDLAGRIETLLDEPSTGSVVHFLPAHPTVLARRDDAYRSVLNRAELNLPDGASVTWALRLSRHRATRLTGSDAFDLLCRWGVDRGISHFLYGGTPELLDRLRSRMEERYPGISVAGAIAPPFRALTTDELDAHAEVIRSSGADLLWIGLGTPRQDFVAESFRAAGCARVVLAVGAVFDFASGTKRRAPLLVQRVGLEWAFRFAQEPRRLARRYLVGNTLFVADVLRDLCTRPTSAPEPPQRR